MSQQFDNLASLPADGAGPSSNGDAKDGQPTSRELFYKTRLCDKFMQYGDCPYGDRCHYAHGYPDLREKGSMTVCRLALRDLLCDIVAESLHAIGLMYPQLPASDTVVLIVALDQFFLPCSHQ